jgi:hypothetical protein
MLIKGEGLSSEYTHYPVRLNISTTLTNANLQKYPLSPELLRNPTQKWRYYIRHLFQMRFGERLLFFYITDLYEYDLSLPYFDDRVINSLTDIIVVAQDIIDIIALLDLALTVISNKILRELKILCLLFNKSLRKKKKIHRIGNSPILSRSSKLVTYSVSNYRPVGIWEGH